MKLALVPATPWQRGFWIDRPSDRATYVGLGRLVLVIDHVARAGKHA